MDVLYYWKDVAADLKAGRIGWFRSSNERLAEFQNGHPDYIWVVKTPRGMKGKLQLLARVVWSDHPAKPVPTLRGQSFMYYDADAPGSVWFEGSDADTEIERVSRWMQLHFPAAVSANFQGVNGQQALRGAVSQELVTLAKSFQPRPFRTIPQRASASEE